MIIKQPKPIKMITTKKSTIILSHLSDIQEVTHDKLIHERINFIKLLILDKREELSNDVINNIWDKVHQNQIK